MDDRSVGSMTVSNCTNPQLSAGMWSGGVQLQNAPGLFSEPTPDSRAHRRIIKVTMAIHASWSPGIQGQAMWLKSSRQY